MSGDATRVKEKFASAVLEAGAPIGQETVVVESSQVVEVLRHLRDTPDLSYTMMVDVTGVDYLGWPEPVPARFAVVYHLWSLARKRRIRVKAFLKGDPPRVPSAVGLFPLADWGEREVYDLMGIHFDGHPNLRRIMLPESFEAHPLRKEYPLEGLGERHDFETYDPESEI